jgi:hypothetical protein
MAQQNSVDINVNVQGNAVESIGNVKKALKEANAELINAQSNFGDYSQEAIAAAKKVAELKDRISEARETADLFDPGKKFQALAGAATAVAGGFTAVQGALGLVGVESEEVEKSLLKVQSALALSQGLSTITDSVKDFERLGTVIKSTTVFQSAYNFVMGKKVAIQEADVITTIQATAATEAHAAATNSSTTATAGSTVAMKAFRGALLATGIGAIVIGITLLIQNFDKVKKVVTNLFPGLAQLGSFFGNIITKVTDFIGVTSQAERALTSLEKTTKRGNEGIEARIKVLTAQGGKEKEIYALSKQQGENELNFLRAKLKTKQGLNDEELKKFRDLKTEQAVLDIQEQKRQQEALKENAKAGAEASKAAAEQRKKNNEDRIAAEKEAQKQLADLRNQLFLSTFKDENEKKKAELNLAFIKEKDEILANTKITEATRNELIVAARLKLNADLDAIAVAEKEKKDAADAKLLEDSAAKMQKEDEDEFNILKSKNKKLFDENVAFKEADANIDKLSAEQKIALAQQTADALVAVSSIIGKETAAGKALAISAALINTYQGISAGVKLGFPAAIPAVALAAATGFSAVKNIIATKVPGGASSGGAGNMSAPNVSAAAPIAPPQPQAATTNLSNQTINAIGNQAIRSYVVESDVTSNQQRIAAIQQRARFG